MTSKSYFKLLSVELIERILLEIIRPADLLSLALTERRLSSIIIPDFLEYCCLDFNIARWDVWEHLVKQPLACSRIGRLKLAIDGLPRPRSSLGATIMLPQLLRSMTLGNCPDEELGSNTICSALTQMSNLKQIVITHTGNRVSIQKLFALVRGVYDSGCGLERINIRLYYSPSWAVTESGLSHIKILYNASWLSHVKIFRLSLHHSGQLNYNPNDLGPELNSYLLGVIMQMPNLTHLELGTPDRRPLLHDDMVYKWSKLEFLQLISLPTAHYGSSLTAPANVQHFDLEAFAAGHPRLHTVYLCLEGVILVQKPSRRNTNDEGIVLALKNLTYTSYAEMIPGSLKEARLLLRNLSHLTITPLDSSTFSIIGELKLLESCVILESSTVKVEPAVISTVFRGCKSLRKLSFPFSYMASLTMFESFALFQDLPNLTHLFGTTSRNRCFPGPDGDAVLKTLYKFPKLRFIDCYYDMHEVLGVKRDPRDDVFHHTFAELRRDDILKQMTYEFIESSLLPRSCFEILWGVCCNLLETII